LRYLLLRRASRTCAATSCIWRRRRWRADHQSNRFDTGFFFRVTLKRHEIVEHTHVIHEQRKLPLVLSVEEVARLLEPARRRAITRATYSCPQRVGKKGTELLVA
jgi:hypothetical protein